MGGRGITFATFAKNRFGQMIVGCALASFLSACGSPGALDLGEPGTTPNKVLAKEYLGVTLGSGLPTTTSNKFEAAVAAMSNEGYQAARFSYSYSDLLAMGYGLSGCGASSSLFLSCALGSTASSVVATLKASPFKTIVLSVRDGTTNGAKYLDYSFTSIPTNRSTLQSEYTSFASTLANNLKGTGKTIIIVAPDADDAIYCNDAYGYATNATTKSNCDTTNSALGGTSQVFNSYALYEADRKAGIEAASTFTGITIRYGIEGNSATLLQAASPRIPNVFKDIVFSQTTGTVPVVLYNAKESLVQGAASRNVVARLQSDLAVIRGLAPTGAPLIIGKYGFSVNDVGQASAQSYTNDVLGLVNAQVASGLLNAAFLYQYYEDSSSPGYGLFEVAGTVRGFYQTIKSVLFGGSISTSPLPFIMSVGPGTYDNQATSTMLVSGSFPFALSETTGVAVDSDCGITGNLYSAKKYSSSLLDNGSSANLIYSPSSGVPRTCRFRVSNGGELGAYSSSQVVSPTPTVQILSNGTASGVGLTGTVLFNGIFRVASASDLMVSNTTGGAATVSSYSPTQVQVTFDLPSTPGQTPTFTISNGTSTIVRSTSAAIAVPKGVGLQITSASTLTPSSKARVNLLGKFYSGSCDASMGGICPFQVTAACSVGSITMPTQPITLFSSSSINVEFPVDPMNSRTCAFSVSDGGSYSAGPSNSVVIAPSLSIATIAQSTNGTTRTLTLNGSFDTGGIGSINITGTNCTGRHETITSWTTSAVTVTLDSYPSATSCNILVTSTTSVASNTINPTLGAN